VLRAAHIECDAVLANRVRTIAREIRKLAKLLAGTALQPSRRFNFKYRSQFAFCFLVFVQPDERGAVRVTPPRFFTECALPPIRGTLRRPAPSRQRSRGKRRSFGARYPYRDRHYDSGAPGVVRPGSTIVKLE
jgi:hypothetical protein